MTVINDQLETWIEDGTYERLRRAGYSRQDIEGAYPGKVWYVDKEDMGVGFSNVGKKKSPLVLITSGGDWFDASADVLVPPDGADFKADIADYPGYRSTQIFLLEWLKTQRSWRDPTDDELHIYHEG